MLSIKCPSAAKVAGKSRLQTIKLAEGTIADIGMSGLFQFQSGISFLRSIRLQLPVSRSARSAGDLQLPTARSVLLDAHETVQAVAVEIMGTNIDMNAPLNSIGLDSLAAVEFTNTLAARLTMDLDPTILFDHPTLDSLAQFLSNELQSNEMISKMSREEDSISQRDDDKSAFLFINPTAKHGIVVWRQYGDASKPVVVILNGISGLAAGAELPRYLPNDVSIISIQAPDLLENVCFKSITERAAYYLKTLVSELDGHS